MNPSTHRLLRDPLVPAALCLLVAFILSVLFLVSYKYSAYAMLALLSLVAATGCFTLFEEDVVQFSSGLVIYVLLVVPFFLTYNRFASSVDLALAEGFAMASVLVVLTAVFLAYRGLVGLPLFKLLQLARRFLKSRRWRYSLSLLSIIVFAAGVTSFSLILPFYALLFFSLILVCEVAINIIGSPHERKREIFSLATLGLNPDHLVTLLLAEAFIIGFLGGGIGYSVGLYVLILTPFPITSFEISTGWMVTVILLSVAAAIVSAILPALKAWMLATPSLLKRWWREAPQFVGWLPTWTFKMPVRLTKDNAERFIDLFSSYARWLEKFPHGSAERAEEVQVMRPEDSTEPTWKLKFKYFYNELSRPAIIAENELGLIRRPGLEELTPEFTIRVIKCEGADACECLRRIASTYRQLTLEWTTRPQGSKFEAYSG